MPWQTKNEKVAVVDVDAALGENRTWHFNGHSNTLCFLVIIKLLKAFEKDLNSKMHHANIIHDDSGGV